jgi:hypothetical protein
MLVIKQYNTHKLNLVGNPCKHFKQSSTSAGHLGLPSENELLNIYGNDWAGSWLGLRFCALATIVTTFVYGSRTSDIRLTPIRRKPRVY